MKFHAQHMNQLLKTEPALQKELKTLMKDMGLERHLAIKALYHAQVADGGTYQDAYKAIER